MKSLFKNKLYLGVILIILGGFLLRLIQVDSLPPALNWDEVSHGYNAYSLLKMGKDEWGVVLPTIFRAYGDYKLPVYIYLTTIPVFILGLSELSVRLVSVVAGTAAILFVYLLTDRLYRDKRISLLASLLFAINPWSLFLSRIAVEANLALFFIIAGFYFLLAGLTAKSAKLLLGIALLGLSVWTYNSARIFVPISIAIFLVIYWQQVKKFIAKNTKTTGLAIVIGLCLFGPMVYQLVNPAGQARYGWVKIIDEGMIAKIIEARQISTYSPSVARLIHNKASYFVVEFSENYLRHFDPSFLFYKGGSHYQFNVVGYGLLFPVGMPFFVVGLVKAFLDWRKNKNIVFVLAWIILAPIASSLTREAPHALRALVMLPMPIVFTSVGIVATYVLLIKRSRIIAYVFGGLLIFGFSFSLINYWRVYSNEYKTKYSWVWQYGYKQAVSYVDANFSNYDKIVFTKKYGEPHEFILFWTKTNPMAFTADPKLIRFYQSDWYWVDGFSKYYFVNDWQIVSDSPQEFTLESGGQVDCESVKCLLVTSPGNVPPGWRKLEEIKFLDGNKAFEIYTNH